jgi:cellulose biosynthesis protein BcsQ
MEDKNAVQGAINLLGTLSKLRDQDQRVALKTLVRVKADPTRQAHRALGALERQGYPVADTDLRARADWNNAAVEGKPVVLWAPSSDAAADACKLAVELWPELRFPYPSEIRSRVRELRPAAAPTAPS